MKRFICLTLTVCLLLSLLTLVWSISAENVFGFGAVDLLAVKKHLLTSAPLDEDGVKKYDLNGDDKVTSVDLLLLRKLLLGSWQPTSTKKTKITGHEAMEIVKNYIDGEIINFSVNFDNDINKLVYKIKVLTGDVIHNIEVSYMHGEILSDETSDYVYPAFPEKRFMYFQNF